MEQNHEIEKLDPNYSNWVDKTVGELDYGESFRFAKRDLLLGLSYKLFM